MSEEELRKDIKETKYNEENVEKLLYELENDTGNYSCYDNAIAIIYYKDLYQKEKEKNKLLIEGKFREVANKNDYIKDNYISKDKIKDKIKEYETTLNQNIFTKLQVIEHGFPKENVIQIMIKAKVEILKRLLEE